jgi:hypothetical protein
MPTAIGGGGPVSTTVLLKDNEFFTRRGVSAVDVPDGGDIEAVGNQWYTARARTLIGPPRAAPVAFTGTEEDLEDLEAAVTEAMDRCRRRRRDGLTAVAGSVAILIAAVAVLGASAVLLLRRRGS